MPVGLVSIGAKLSGLLERVLPGVGGGDAAGAAAGGAGLLGVGGAKLAGLLAAGAVATGGGLVVAQDAHERAGHREPPGRTVRGVAARPATGVATPPPVAVAPARRSPAKAAARRGGRPQRTDARGAASRRRIEFAPGGGDLAPMPVARSVAKAVRATAPRPVPAGSDSTRGEFAPQP